MRLGSALIFVRDLDRMTAFYSGALGLKPIEATRLENWVEFEGGGIRLSLHAIPPEMAGRIPASPEPREQASIKLIFEVPDLAAEVRRLESLGVRLLPRPWGAVDGIDPEGNVFGIVSRP